MDPESFSPEIRLLLERGETGLRGRPWTDYAGLGISPSQVPELIRLVELATAEFLDEYAETDFVYAPIHAWRALGQLRAPEAIEPLIRMAIRDAELDWDWIMEDIPTALSMIGTEAIPALRDFVVQPGQPTWPAVTMSHALQLIGENYPEARAECVAALTAGLANFKDNDDSVNAFLISYLKKLKAAEPVDIVRAAFEAHKVDLSLLGDFEDYQVGVGLLEKRLSPPLEYTLHSNPLQDWMKDQQAAREAGRRVKQAQVKDKRKRKQASQSRKKQRKKKR